MSAGSVGRTLATAARRKISLIGAGQIGSILGVLAGLKRLGNVHFFDIATNICEGKALDLNQFTAVEHLPCEFAGNTSYEDLKGTDVAIITAGLPRKPGMQRSDLLAINAGIISEIAQAVKQYCPEAFIICVTNPLDAMVYHFQKVSGLPPNRVVGMAGVLDAARFKYFLSKKLNISSECIQSLILGGHADSMVLFPRFTSVKGIPLPEFIKMGYITEKDVHDIIERTRFGGQEIVGLLKTGSAFMTPAASAIEMAEAYLYDKKSILACAAHLDGEYGVKGLYAGVPVIIGAQGVEKVVQLPLTAEENQEFQASVNEVKAILQALEEAKKPKN